MSNISGAKARIEAIEVYVPEGELTNDDLSIPFPDWSTEKIYSKTGIKTRHIAGCDETAGDLAYEAAKKLLSRADVISDDVDFLILCTQAPDYILPTTACILQHKLNLSKSIGALDINLGCSGYVYGLSLAKGLIESGIAKNVMLITADTYSKYIHPMDKSVRTLFGDAATATMLVATESEAEKIGSFVFGTDGSGAQSLIVPAGGFRCPKTNETKGAITDEHGNTRSEEHLFMNGSEVMSFSLREVPKAAKKILTLANHTPDNIDYFVFHQANKFMLEALQKKMKLPENKVPLYVENYGNTVSSSIPIALYEMIKDGLLKEGAKVVLLGFGVGLSWAGCIVKF